MSDLGHPCYQLADTLFAWADDGLVVLELYEHTLHFVLVPRLLRLRWLHDPAQKLIQISPIVNELGITWQVLLHEAVHAAQSCPKGKLTLLGIKRKADPAVESRIQYLLSHHYLQEHMALEKEAFLIQGQDDAEALVIKALKERCQRPLK